MSERTKADRVAEALRNGGVETMSVGDRAVTVNMRNGECEVIYMTPERTRMLWDTVLMAARREETTLRQVSPKEVGDG